MTGPFSRRTFVGRLAGAASAAALAAVHPFSRLWAGSRDTVLADLPGLDGSLHTDPATRHAVSWDWGQFIRREPRAVVRPGSAEDVQRMVRYANEHRLGVAMRGQAHSRYGQALADGLVIDSNSLNQVGAVEETSIWVQAGASWGQVARATVPRGLTPPVMPDCYLLTVGGTLGAGGLGNTSQRFGAQGDQVLALDVVTGSGDLVRCSPTESPELFEMSLGGLGQCALIVRARLALIPAPDRVLLYHLLYDDLQAYLDDQRRLAADGRFDHQGGRAIRAQDGQWRYSLEAGIFYADGERPDLASREAGLKFSGRADPVDTTYLEYVYRQTGIIDRLKNAPDWADPHPAVTMWIPAGHAERFSRLVQDIAPEAAGFGEYRLWPVPTGPFRRPMLRMPPDPLVFTYWIFRTAHPDGPAALEPMLASNRQLLAEMRAAGGKRYLPYGMVMSPADWQEHLGSDLWRRLVAAKRRYDPNNVLTPGAGAFPRS
jgi:cytokinin dehydrogenase